MQPRLKPLELNHSFISAVLLLSVLPLSLEYLDLRDLVDMEKACLLPAMPMHEPPRKKQEIGARVQAH